MKVVTSGSDPMRSYFYFLTGSKQWMEALKNLESKSNAFSIKIKQCSIWQRKTLLVWFFLGNKNAKNQMIWLFYFIINNRKLFLKVWSFQSP